MSLYQITTEMQAILDAMLDGGIDCPESMQALDAHLQGLDAALEDKAERYAQIIRELELRAKARTEEAQRIRTLAQADAALAERLKQRLKEAMETSGRTKIQTSRFSLAVAQNGGKQPLEIDVAYCPQWDAPFVTTVVEPNKDAIRKALEAGQAIPGCTLLPRGNRLVIK